MNTQPLIAVVDDDLDLLRAMNRLIRAHGYAVRVFPSGTEFLESAAQVAPECVIMDFQMPAMTGLELQNRMHAQGMDIPVIFVTAHEDQQDEARAAEAGAAGYMYKPFRSETLWAAVDAALDHAVH